MIRRSLCESGIAIFALSVTLNYADSPFNIFEIFRYTLGRNGHKDAPLRLLNPDEVAELVPILKMDNVRTFRIFRPSFFG